MNFLSKTRRKKTKGTGREWERRREGKEDALRSVDARGKGRVREGKGKGRGPRRRGTETRGEGEDLEGRREMAQTSHREHNNTLGLS